MDFSINDILGILSFLVSALALFYTWKVDGRSKKLQDEVNASILKDREEAEDRKNKADIQCHKIHDPHSKTGCMRIVNNGASDALNLDFTCDDDDLQFLEKDEDVFPYPKLVSGQSVDVHYICMSHAAHQTIKFSWDDKYRDGKIKEIVLNL